MDIGVRLRTQAKLTSRMNGPRLLVPLLAMGALLLAAPVAASTTAEQGIRPASIEFDLPANHGFRAHLETSGEVDLQVIRRGD
jgi:hypothetical protein